MSRASMETRRELAFYYHKIIKAYIKHVVECEGTDFLYGSHGYPDGLTNSELAVLLHAHDEVDKENRK